MSSSGPSPAEWPKTIYVCGKCGDVTDAHGEPVGCVNVACDSPTMEQIQVIPAEPALGAEELARRFHETYERLAPGYGYETRKASAVPWEDVPEQNKRLMVAVCEELSAALSYLRGGE